jgi:soluble lytic murein transglycosylase
LRQVKLKNLSHISRRGFLAGLGLAIAAPTFAFAAPGSLAIQAAQKALSGDFTAAGLLAKQSQDTAAIKLVELIYLKDHGGTAGYSRIVDFLNGAPNWPLTPTLMKRAEEALYKGNESAATIQGHFAKRKPVTPFGALALARAARAAGDNASVAKYVRQAWFDPDADATLEQQMSSEFGSQLNASDRRTRVWRLIYAQQGRAAVRNADRIGGEMMAAAQTAQLLIEGSSAGEKKYRGLSSAMREELAIKYTLARFYRRKENFAQARAILVTVPGDAAAMGDAEAWYEERRNIVRRSVGPKNSASWKAAYQIARNHGISGGDFVVDAHFLAGWVALRYMRDPRTAMEHFVKLQKAADTRTEQSRALYWIGRTYQAMGDQAKAKASYRDAAVNTTVYYGQLAREQIGLGKKPQDISSHTSSAATVAAVNNDEVVRAFRIMSQAGSKNQLNIFFWSLATRFDSEQELNAVAGIIHDAAGTSWALRFAKACGKRDVDLDDWAYPIRGLPQWRQLGKPVEKALVYALSRQESEFDPNAGSNVGAQGLMQLMPGTANLIARQYRVPYAVGRLKSDPTYNVELGAAHLADLVESFGGSYVLTLVGYNAGPRRSKEWLQAFGDLRGAQVDPIDWVECIPFNETRQYVQKVLQNVQIYRSRLAPETLRPMTADLARGTPQDVTTVSSTSKVAENTCNPTSIADLAENCN